MHRSLQTAECSVPDVVRQNLEEVSVLKARIKFKKYGALRFIGHLDVMRFFQKAIRRAHIPIAYTGGYSPHMIMSFANPLGIGITSEGEYFDIELKESISSAEAVSRLNAVMVEVMEAFCRFLDADATQLKFALCRLEMYADSGDENARNLVTLESLGTVIE